MISINPLIDYTLLDFSVTDEELSQVCTNAIKLNVASVCVYPSFVSKIKEQLINTPILTCTVIAFPVGDNSIIEKVKETEEAILAGADEIDMVLNYSKINDVNYLKNELEAVNACCKKHKDKLGQPITLKVIVESGLLSLEETKIVTEICIETNVDFIKTSTGKIDVGAELSKVKMMFDTCISHHSNLKIKASGGIRTLEAINMFLPYVNRLGIGYKTVDILNEI